MDKFFGILAVLVALTFLVLGGILVTLNEQWAHQLGTAELLLSILFAVGGFMLIFKRGGGR